MPKQLYLLRHADSVPKQIGDHDKDRELTSNGIKESMIIGTFLQKNATQIDQIISSTANRAKSTTQIVSDAMHADPDKIIFIDELYEASFRTFYDVLTNLESGLNNVMFVGHNPTISYVAEFLATSPLNDMATCGLAIIKFNVGAWKDVTKGSGELASYTYPAQLVNT
jgi:phosphohistidine phosphatase